MNKRKVRITNTGYLPNSPDRHNPMNIIPSSQITMNSVPFPILGIDNLGNHRMMMPGMDYTFPGQYVTEIPMGSYDSRVRYNDLRQKQNLAENIKNEYLRNTVSNYDPTNFFHHNVPNELLTNLGLNRNEENELERLSTQGYRTLDEQSRNMEFAKGGLTKYQGKKDSSQVDEGHVVDKTNYKTPLEESAWYKYANDPNNSWEARQTIGWNPEHVSIDNTQYGIEQMIAWDYIDEWKRLGKAGTRGMNLDDWYEAQKKTDGYKQRLENYLNTYEPLLESFYINYDNLSPEEAKLKAAQVRKPWLTYAERHFKPDPYHQNHPGRREVANDEDTIAQSANMGAYPYSINWELKARRKLLMTPHDLKRPSEPIYASNYGQHKGQVQIGENIWDDWTKTWKRKMFTKDEIDNLIKQGAIQKKNGGLIKYQDKGQVKPKLVEYADPKEYQRALNLYNDQMILYNAYQFQKANAAAGYNAWLRDRADGNPAKMEQIRKARATNIGPIGREWYTNDYKKSYYANNRDADYDPMYPEEQAIINEYRRLIGDGFRTRNSNFRIGMHNSPDLWHRTIRPIGSYNDGSNSPIYAYPTTKPTLIGGTSNENLDYIEPIPLVRMPTSTLGEITYPTINPEYFQKAEPIWEYSNKHKTGKYQKGIRTWNEQEKKWKHRLFKEPEEKEWYYNQSLIKKQMGGLTEYQKKGQVTCPKGYYSLNGKCYLKYPFIDLQDYSPMTSSPDFDESKLTESQRDMIQRSKAAIDYWTKLGYVQDPQYNNDSYFGHRAVKYYFNDFKAPDRYNDEEIGPLFHIEEGVEPDPNNPNIYYAPSFDTSHFFGITKYEQDPDLPKLKIDITDQGFPTDIAYKDGTEDFKRGYKVIKFIHPDLYNNKTALAEASEDKHWCPGCVQKISERNPSEGYYIIRGKQHSGQGELRHWTTDDKGTRSEKYMGSVLNEDWMSPEEFEKFSQPNADATYNVQFDPSKTIYKTPEAAYKVLEDRWRKSAEQKAVERRKAEYEKIQKQKQKKQGGIYLGEYEFRNGGLVKMPNGGPKEKGWREYKTPTGESLYLDPRFKNQRYYVNEKGEHVTPNQNMSLYDVTDNVWEAGTSMNTLNISAEEATPFLASIPEDVKAQMLDQGTISPATTGAERLKNQFIYAMDQPLDAMGSLMQRGYVPQGNLNGDYETASPMSSVIGAFNPVSVLMDIGRVGRDLGEKETYTTWGGAGEAGLNVAGFLPFGDIAKKVIKNLPSNVYNKQDLLEFNKKHNLGSSLEDIQLEDYKHLPRKDAITIDRNDAGPYSTDHPNFTREDQQKAFEEAQEFNRKWAYNEEGLADYEKNIRPKIEEYEKAKQQIWTDLYGEHQVLTKKMDEIDKLLDDPKNFEKFDALNEEYNELNKKRAAIVAKADADDIEVRKKIEELESSIDIYDKDFERKALAISNSDANVHANSLGHNPDKLPPIVFNKDRNKLVYYDKEDPSFKNLLKEERDYLDSDVDKIAGVKKNSSTITLGTKGKPITTTHLVNENGQQYLVDLNQNVLVPPENVGWTNAHEIYHDYQDIGGWGDVLAKFDDKYDYYTSNPNTDLGKRFGKAMVTPDENPWRSSPNELGSDLMGARYKVAKQIMNLRGLSMDEAIKVLKQDRDDFTDYLIHEGSLDRFFKPETTQGERRDLVKIMPALAPALGLGYLGKKLYDSQQQEQPLKKSSQGVMTFKDGGIYLGKYEFKDGGLVKYQKKGQVKEELKKFIQSQEAANQFENNVYGNTNIGGPTITNEKGQTLQFNPTTRQYEPINVVVSPKSFAPSKQKPTKQNKDKTYSQLSEKEKENYVTNQGLIYDPELKSTVSIEGLKSQDPERLVQLYMQEFVDEQNKGSLQKKLGKVDLSNPVTRAAAQEYAKFKITGEKPGTAFDQMMSGNTPNFYRPYDASKVFGTVAALPAIGTGILGAQALPGALATAETMLNAPIVVAGSTIPGVTVGNTIGALGAGYGITKLPNTWNTVQKAYDNPTTSNITDAAEAVGMNALDFFGVGIGKSIVTNSGKLSKYWKNYTAFDRYWDRVNKLPLLNNADASEVLNNFFARINTPEGQQRLKDLGITSTDVFNQLKMVADDHDFGYYWNGIIGAHPELPTPFMRETIRHEIEHGVRDARTLSLLEQFKWDRDNFKFLFNQKKKKEAFDFATRETTDIDELLKDLDLIKTPKKVNWNTRSIDTRRPIKLPSNAQGYMEDLQKATNYFDSGSGGNEKSPFLAEVQQWMMDTGRIPSTSYVKITPDMVEEAYKAAKSDTGFARNLRLFNIMKPTEANYELVAKGLNKMLSLTPMVGAGYLGSKLYKNLQERPTNESVTFKNGGLVKAQEGREMPFASPYYFEPTYIKGDDNEQPRYEPTTKTIYYKDMGSDAETNAVLEHEKFHWLQDLQGRIHVNTGQGPVKRPAGPVTDEHSGNYYNRLTEDANQIGSGLIQQNPSFQFVPEDVMYNSYIAPIQYEIPWTTEGEARQYEKYIRSGGKSMFKKQGGLVKAQKGLNKRMVRQYPGMKGVYGEKGENLNVIRDKNFVPADYGYGNIEFIYPGSGLVTYNDQYSYQSPTPDKYTAVYNPKGANKHDVFLDMMHGMRHDPEYMELLNEFADATRNARGADMDYFFDQDAQRDPNFVIDGREQWDKNYIDGMVRAHMYKLASQEKHLPFVNPFGSKPHGTEDYEMELEPNSPEMYHAADQIYNYIKGDKRKNNSSLKKVKIKSLPRKNQ